MVKKTVRLPVYDCNVHFYFGSEKEINKKGAQIEMKVWGRAWGDALCYACVIKEKTVHNYHIMFATESLDLKLITHEITHLGCDILGDRGHRVDGDSESLAYLNGYLAGEIEKILHKNNIETVKPKHGKQKKEDTAGKV